VNVVEVVVLVDVALVENEVAVVVDVVESVVVVVGLYVVLVMTGGVVMLATPIVPVTGGYEDAKSAMLINIMIVRLSVARLTLIFNLDAS
jgi:hypothetical protein